MMKVIERARTGIRGLDEYLEGGIPRPSSVLISGDIGTKKNTLAQRILYQGLVEGEKGIYVTVDLFPRDIVENMARYNMNIEDYLSEHRLIFIDGLSPRLGYESSAEYIVENPFNLDEMLRLLSLAINENIHRGEKYRLVLSHLSTLLFMTQKRRLLSFIERLHAEAKRSNGIFIMVYSEGVLSKHSENFIKSLPDVVFQLSRLENKRMLEVLRCIKTSYIPRKFVLSQHIDSIQLEA